MGTARAFFQLPGIALSFIIISNNLVSYGITTSPPNFKISPRMPFGPKDFFLPTADNRFLVMVTLMVNRLFECVDLICGLLLSKLNRDA